MTLSVSLILNIIYNVVTPMNAGFMVFLNITEIAFIVYTGLKKKVGSMPYLLCLSVSDLFTGLTIFGAKACWAAEEITGSKLLFTIADYASGVMIDIPLFVSVSTFTMLTIDRLLAVKKPFIYRNFTQRRRTVICIAIWVLAIVTSFSHDKQAYFIGFLALAGIPFPIVGYILIRRTLIKSQAMGANGEGREANKSERRMLSLCFKTFVAYLVSWIPYSIFQGFYHFNVVSREYLDLINYIVFSFIFINSSVNPLICLHHFGVHRIIKNHFIHIFEQG